MLVGINQGYWLEIEFQNRLQKFTQHPDTSTRTTENLATLVGINEAQLNYMLEVR